MIFFVDNVKQKILSTKKDPGKFITRIYATQNENENIINKKKTSTRRDIINKIHIHKKNNQQKRYQQKTLSATTS